VSIFSVRIQIQRKFMKSSHFARSARSTMAVTGEFRTVPLGIISSKMDMSPLSFFDDLLW
jgi:hypothetical protein